MDKQKFTINSEAQFYKFVSKLEDDGKITEEEADAMCNYVCGILDEWCGMNDTEEEEEEW
jgi:hypothetical protein